MKCTFCKNEYFSKPIKVYSSILKYSINYYKCKNCRSIIQFPLPDNNSLKKYYESYMKIKKEMNPGYLTTHNKSLLFNERSKTLKEIGFDINRFKKTINVEIGCANGHFLEYMKNNGAENIIGIDISKDLLDSIQIDGIKKINGTINDLNDINIDNIFLFNILEHSPDVNELIRSICKKLKKSGQLIIEIPISGFISSLFKNNWRFLMPNEHLHIPSIKGMRILLNSYSLSIKSITRFGSGFTSGTIPRSIKYLFDSTTKFLGFGDRGALLCEQS